MTKRLFDMERRVDEALAKEATKRLEAKEESFPYAEAREELLDTIPWVGDPFYKACDETKKLLNDDHKAKIYKTVNAIGQAVKDLTECSEDLSLSIKGDPKHTNFTTELCLLALRTSEIKLKDLLAELQNAVGDKNE